MIKDPDRMLTLGRSVSVSKELLRDAKYHDILIDDAKRQLSHDIAMMITDEFVKETDRDNSVEFNVNAYLIDKDYFYQIVMDEAMKLNYMKSNFNVSDKPNVPNPRDVYKKIIR